MSGRNYHISLQQILETERKLKICTAIKLSNGEIRINNLFDNKENNVEEIVCHEIDISFYSGLFDDIDIETHIDSMENIVSSLVYIGGYICFKLEQSLKCAMCISLFRREKNLILEASKEFELIHYLDRGKLKYPSDYLLKIVIYCYIIFNRLVSKANERFYLGNNIKQKMTLVYVTEIFLMKENIINDCETCNCGNNNKNLVKKCLIKCANIFIGNYIKNKNNQELCYKNTQQRKRRKFDETLN